MISLSAGLDKIKKNPEYDFQWSTFECDEEYIERLWDEPIPQNVSVIHFPPKTSKSHWKRLIDWAVLNNDRPIVIHPNISPLQELSQYEGKGHRHICIENFPWSSKKPLRNPLSIADYAIRNQFGVCFDYAHVDPWDEPAFRTPEFLRAYLPWVSVIHFSGNRHNPLTEEDWKTWETVILNHPGCLAQVRWFCLEHKDESGKVKDANRLVSVLQRLGEQKSPS